VTTKRVVVCLDMKAGRVVKGVQFEGLREVGDPVQLAARYELEGADEIVFLDVSASNEERAPLWAIATRTAEQLSIPLTIGGGLTCLDDATKALRAGADKVSFNSSAVKNPSLIGECAKVVGSQCVVVSIDARREGDAWRVYTHGGQRATGLDALEWAKRAVAEGAGELLVTSIDRDGRRTGYDLGLTRAVADAVEVPVIASGGAGEAGHLIDAFTEGRAEAALVAGILHDATTTVGALKRQLAAAGLDVRAVRS
jgi:cyclase